MMDTTETAEHVTITVDELHEILEFVRTAKPVLDELAEHLPKLRDLAPVLQQIAQGGPAGLIAVVGGMLRSPKQ